MEERRKMEAWQPARTFLDRGYSIEHLHGTHLRCLLPWLLPALLSLQQANEEGRQAVERSLRLAGTQRNQQNQGYV